MKVVALAQAYDEAMFAEKALYHYYDLVDGMVLTEGLLTPFGNMPVESPDGTRKIMSDFVSNNDVDGKVIFLLDSPNFGKSTNREGHEGYNKQRMLEKAEERFGLQDGDVLFILDFDEFFAPEAFAYHVDLMKKNPGWNFIVSEEWQFAYNMGLAFKASHGRFYRYRKGMKFGSTNHFYLPNGGADVSRSPDFIVPRKDAGFFHLCWIKSPELIREKVVSFNRPSFTNWFNYVYLAWPLDEHQAYINNRSIPPYYGTGFAEGQHEKLVKYLDELPKILQDIDVNWIEEIRYKARTLVIR